MSMKQDRTLTHDEKKASEAAFRGLPFNPAWSDSAKKVYDGIVQVLGNSSKADAEILSQAHLESENVYSEESSSKETGVEEIRPEERKEDQEVPMSNEDDPEAMVTLTMTADSLPLDSRKTSITAGVVKDATPAAKRIGLEIPVGLTNALWKNYVAISQDMSEDHIQSRLQDIMVGVRLRLASLKEAMPFVDVPILLDFPPDAVPQVNLAFALFHRDPEEGPCLLLIHPGEIFSPNQNISQN
jgi:hypothetical protein